MGLKFLKRGAAIAATIVLASSTVVRAESLPSALAAAYNNSGLLEQNRAVLRAADEDVAQAMASLRPTLSYIARTYGDYFDAQNPAIGQGSVLSGDIFISAQVILFDFGRNQLSVEAAKEAVLATRQGLISVEQQVLYDAVSAYMGLHRDQEFVRLARSNLAVLTQELQATQDRFDVGEVTRTDVSLAQASLESSRSDLVEAQGQEAISREVYRTAIGKYPTGYVEPPRAPTTPSSLEAARQVALRTHPDILAAQKFVRVAEINEQAARLAYRPTLSATARAGYTAYSQTFNRSDASVGLELSGPIYQGGRIPSVQRQALANVQGQRANLHQARLYVDENVGRAWSILLVSRASLEALKAQVVAATEAFEGVREEARLGARTTLDVLNSEQNLLDARARVIDATTNQYLAAYGLLASMGLLTAENLNLNVQTYDPETYYRAVENAPAAFSQQGRALDRVLKSLSK
ncbi:TolC family outer membrane protein [Halocynthiibacter sp. C4]|uniref:TolC family outer membrane protein n=1 Tax=Halocynthiibacter sp. C4 TaxID=2992758 RepID=UPI00237A7C53|nr:TolC family outer membrane protein [Halocynthiibacter sp. C4]MDE0588961.1 TolC family outer membrane protein [Halocynthiibacter sp. C4]